MQQQDTFVTETNIDPKIYENNTLQSSAQLQVSHLTNQPIYQIEKITPPSLEGFETSTHFKLPVNVNLSRVKDNILSTLNINEKLKFKWKEIFYCEEVDAIISDSFWFAIARLFKNEDQQ